MVAPGISEGVCHFDVARGTLKCRVGTLVWPSGTLNKSSKFIKCIKCSDVVVLLAGGAAEVPKE